MKIQKQLQQQLQEAEQARILRDIKAAQSRARSISVGTAFGGTTEVNMRLEDGTSVWCPMQPVEVIELIHQLAANVGCHIALKPRSDFSSWREWRVSEAEKKHLQGHAPFVNDMAVFQQLGASGFDQAQAEATVAHNLKQEEYVYVNGGARKKEQANEQTLATQETVRRKRTKRAAAAA
jgi:hypothetical protein